MTRARGFLAIGFTVVLVAALSPAAIPAGSTEAASTEQIRVQPGHLLQNSGSELYHELCASCHGLRGVGNGPMSSALAIPAPALNRLRDAGIPREHWTYVIESPCDDRHHWAPDGNATMPCWKRAFREALGNDVAPLLVSAKLTDYLESIQQ